jgi:AraC-like DNA-binding protein
MSLQITRYPIRRESAISEFADCLIAYAFEGKDFYTLIPEGSFEILFNIQGEFLHQSSCTTTLKKEPQCMLSGLHSEAYDIMPIDGRGICIGIQLKQGWVGNIFNSPLVELKNRVVDLSEIFGSPVSHLYDLLINDACLMQQFKIIEDFFGTNSNYRKPRLPPSIYQYLRENSFATIDHLKDLLNYSNSHIRKLFYEEIGMSPKEYVRILRVSKAAEIIKIGTYSSLTDLTYQFGYCDQSHFIKDFKSVTKRSPGEFAKHFSN